MSLIKKIKNIFLPKNNASFRSFAEPRPAPESSLSGTSATSIKPKVESEVVGTLRSFVEATIRGGSLAAVLRDSISQYLDKASKHPGLFPARFRGDKNISPELGNNIRDIWEDTILEFFIDFFYDQKVVGYVILMAGTELNDQPKLFDSFFYLINGKEIKPDNKQNEAAIYIFEKLIDFKGAWYRCINPLSVPPKMHDLLGTTLENKVCSRQMIKKIEKGCGEKTFKSESFLSILFEEINCYSKDIALAAVFGPNSYDTFKAIFDKTVAASLKKQGHTDKQLDDQYQKMITKMKEATNPDDLVDL